MLIQEWLHLYIRKVKKIYFLSVDMERSIGKEKKLIILHSFSELCSINYSLSANGIDLLMKLLTLNPTERITAADALNHPYFTEGSGTPEAQRLVYVACFFLRAYMFVHSVVVVSGHSLSVHFLFFRSFIVIS